MDNVTNLLTFIDNSPTAFHACANLCEALEKSG